MSEKKKPKRRCAGCGELKDKKELIRVVRTPEGIFTIDPTGKAAGRGAYICRDAGCLEKARKNHGLERSFGQKIDKDVYDRLAEELTNQ
ncbi:MAG: YlxR family protein [Lachnospiraceae bacterium]|uniref:YlxR family protein n=1 Tax=Candidatus Weimeria bifida TaxID=2599074 RepID=A0A6N7IY50_9FIRM|nr:YlxR family protein [Candidatus Weimeria bifida]RRF96034.1 MAG: YlxR family protein [Lachnospiraceae bacterium]